MADQLAEVSWYYYLKFWNEDASQAQFGKEASLSIMFPPFRKCKCEEYAATVRRRLPELLPHWIWIGPLLGEIRPVVYRLSPDKNYHKVGDEEAERLLQRTAYFFDKRPRYASYRELAQWIYRKENPYDTLYFYTKTGENITASIVNNPFFAPYDPTDMPRTLEALKQLRPKYMGYACDWKINIFYILQEDGSYAFASDAVTDILEARMNVPPVDDENDFPPPTEDREEQALLQQAVGKTALALLRNGKGVRRESTEQKVRKP